MLFNSGGLLAESDYVSCRVAEPGSDLGRIRADRLGDLAPVGDNRVDGRGYAVDHDVDEKAGRGCGRAPEYPRAAHLADRIVKGSAAITAFPEAPAEDPLVEIGRPRYVSGGNLDVADLAVRKRGRHQRDLSTLSTQTALAMGARHKNKSGGIVEVHAYRTNLSVPCT
jgi:hypothetical protein